jgi:hypothetical protein
MVGVRWGWIGSLELHKGVQIFLNALGVFYLPIENMVNARGKQASLCDNHKVGGLPYALKATRREKKAFES